MRMGNQRQCVWAFDKGWENLFHSYSYSLITVRDKMPTCYQIIASHRTNQNECLPKRCRDQGHENLTFMPIEVAGSSLAQGSIHFRKRGCVAFSKGLSMPTLNLLKISTLSASALIV